MRKPATLPLAAIPAKQRKYQGSWAKYSIKAIATAGALLAAASTMPKKCAIEPINSKLITSLDNGVTIHGAANSEAVGHLTQIIQAYPRLWEDHGNIVDVPEPNWMPIPLIDDRQLKYTCKAKVYPLGKADKDEVDKEFDKLQEQGKLEWSNQPTPFSYPCFVIWRIMSDGSRKG